jgi:ABC-type sulfate/molybdate transport systems ATPase subunit
MLSLKNVSFSYRKKPVLNSITFSVKPGDCLAIVGQSGSGKSTLLKLIFGKLDVPVGAISWKKEHILGPKNKLVVGHDFMKYVSQEFELMPYTTVAENIETYLSNFFPLEKKRRTKELLKVVELESFANTKVQFLSGGQKQRVALARAIAKQPEVILLDEPFSHIDSFKKQSLRKSYFKYLKTNNIACVMATHDKEDVLPFADHMIVLNNGEVLAKGAPSELYKEPQLPFVAAFFDVFCVINNKIYYAQQLFVVDKSPVKVVVRQSFYKGSFYLIEAQFNESTVYFNHDVELAKNIAVYLGGVDGL